MKKVSEIIAELEERREAQLAEYKEISKTAGANCVGAGMAFGYADACGEMIEWIKDDEN